MTYQEYNVQSSLLRAKAAGALIGLAEFVKDKIDNPDILRIACEWLIEESAEHQKRLAELDKKLDSTMKPIEEIVGRAFSPDWKELERVRRDVESGADRESY
jgi:hypothetical protein